MAITGADVQKLREATGAGIMACKKALEEAKGDFGKAEEILKAQGTVMAAKKSERATKQGLIETYNHGGGRIGVLVEVNCETDFVARNPEFKELTHDIALQISAMKPIDVEDLLAQDFVKDPSMTIKQLVESKIGKLGENVQIGRFARYELGE